MSIILIHPYPGRPEADVRLSGILSHALADREGGPSAPRRSWT